MWGKKELNPQRPGVCSSGTGPQTQELSNTTTPGQSVPPQGKAHPRKGVAERAPSEERGWKQAGLLYSPVRAGQLVGGRRRDE